MSPFFKHIAVSCIVFCASISYAYAQPLFQAGPVQGTGGQTYQPIIQGVGISGADVGSTLQQLFRWGVTLAIILAIIMLVIGGIEYMGSESVFAKGDGMKKIQGALGGLFIALLCIFILNLILGTGGPGSFNVGTFGTGGGSGVSPTPTRNTGGTNNTTPSAISNNGGTTPVSNSGTQSEVQMNTSNTGFSGGSQSQIGNTGQTPSISNSINTGINTSPSQTGVYVDDFGRTTFIDNTGTR